MLSAYLRAYNSCEQVDISSPSWTTGVGLDRLGIHGAVRRVMIWGAVRFSRMVTRIVILPKETAWRHALTWPGVSHAPRPCQAERAPAGFAICSPTVAAIRRSRQGSK